MQQARQWEKATAAMATVEPLWMMFRYMLAQQYNQHQPQGRQGETRAQAAQVADDLIAGLGGAMRALPPQHLDEDQAWSGFIGAVKGLEQHQYRSLMWLIVRQTWGSDLLAQGPGNQIDQHRHTQMRRLCGLLHTMERQQQCNDAGWVYGAGYPRQGKGKGSRIKSLT